MRFVIHTRFIDPHCARANVSGDYLYRARFIDTLARDISQLRAEMSRPPGISPREDAREPIENFFFLSLCGYMYGIMQGSGEARDGDDDDDDDDESRRMDGNGCMRARRGTRERP